MTQQIVKKEAGEDPSFFLISKRYGFLITPSTLICFESLGTKVLQQVAMQESACIFGT